MSTAVTAAAIPSASSQNGVNQNRRETDVIEQKAKRISDIFASLSESQITSTSSNSEKEDVMEDSPQKKLPRSLDEFYNRVGSFEPGLWTVDKISPLECASWGWKLLEKDVLQCVSCHEVICAILPNKKSKVAYDKFFHLLKSRLETSHKDACGWLYNPFPTEFMEPLLIDGEQLRNMKNSVQTLASLNSALPFVNIKRLAATLGTDDDILKALLKNDEAEDDGKIISVLLVLSGWSKGQGSFLRCVVCRRQVGLWSLITIADEFKLTEPPRAKASVAGSRKRKLSEPNTNSAGEGDDNQRVTRQSPRLKNQEPKDFPTPKRMRTRSKEETSSSSPRKPEEKIECLLITSPTTQIEKVEKRYFSPLEEHRFWCPWISKVDEFNDDDYDDDDPPKGFCFVVEQIREHLQVSQQRKSFGHEKYVENVEGLRLIRNLLDELSSE